ncbi:hypothetical protein M885DRAFT_544727 [Pelagophyceae sp. CCMP2097]|nr:hypothetical protein M885DRAFT_544727 [Pelagophyceae sp. CCMP2097]
MASEKITAAAPAAAPTFRMRRGDGSAALDGNARSQLLRQLDARREPAGSPKAKKVPDYTNHSRELSKRATDHSLAQRRHKISDVLDGCTPRLARRLQPRNESDAADAADATSAETPPHDGAAALDRLGGALPRRRDPDGNASLPRRGSASSLPRRGSASSLPRRDSTSSRGWATGARVGLLSLDSDSDSDGGGNVRAEPTVADLASAAKRAASTAGRFDAISASDEVFFAPRTDTARHFASGRRPESALRAGAYVQRPRGAQGPKSPPCLPCDGLRLPGAVFYGQFARFGPYDLFAVLETGRLFDSLDERKTGKLDVDELRAQAKALAPVKKAAHLRSVIAAVVAVAAKADMRVVTLDAFVATALCHAKRDERQRIVAALEVRALIERLGPCLAGKTPFDAADVAVVFSGKPCGTVTLRDVSVLLGSTGVWPWQGNDFLRQLSQHAGVDADRELEADDFCNVVKYLLRSEPTQPAAPAAMARGKPGKAQLRRAHSAAAIGGATTSQRSLRSYVTLQQSDAATRQRPRTAPDRRLASFAVTILN